MSERWSNITCPVCNGNSSVLVEERVLGFPRMTKIPCTNPECEYGKVYTGDALEYPPLVEDRQREHEEWLRDVGDNN